MTPIFKISLHESTDTHSTKPVTVLCQIVLYIINQTKRRILINNSISNSEELKLQIMPSGVFLTKLKVFGNTCMVKCCHVQFICLMDQN